MSNMKTAKASSMKGSMHDIMTVDALEQSFKNFIADLRSMNQKAVYMTYQIGGIWKAPKRKGQWFEAGILIDPHLFKEEDRDHLGPLLRCRAMLFVVPKNEDINPGISLVGK